MKRWLVYAPYLLLSLLVLAPLLLPGFVLSMDMVFTPQLRLPQQVDNTYVFYAVLHVLNFVLPADFIQKCLLVAILLTSGIGLHRLLRAEAQTGRLATYLAGAFYAVNPFVYDRFMAGQYGVLLGYAMVPWFTRALLLFVRGPSARRAAIVAVWVVGMSIVSIHSLGFVVVLILAVVGAYGRQTWRGVVKYGSLAVVIFAFASSYWLLPALLGHGKIADSLGTFTASERVAFATIDANGSGPLGSVLGLQGFWQETRSLFIMPIDYMPGWGAVQLVMWGIMTFGAGMAWRRSRQLAIFMLVVLAGGALLAAGVGVDCLAGHAPFFAGFREPQKFAALVALGEAVLLACAADALFVRAKRWRFGVAAILAILVAAYTPTIWWGFAGQLRPADYPRGWYDINRQLGEAGGQSVLFLPWHLYMSYDFSGGRIIASPAHAFFDASIIASDDPELPGVTPQTPNHTRQLVERQVLPALATSQAIAPTLRKLHIGYILLAKDYDYRQYDNLARQPSIWLVRDTPSLKLYRIE